MEVNRRNLLVGLIAMFVISAASAHEAEPSATEKSAPQAVSARANELDQYVPARATRVESPRAPRVRAPIRALTRIQKSRRLGEARDEGPSFDPPKVFDDFLPYETKLHLKNLEIRDFLAIKYKGATLIRFAIYDSVTKKTEEIAARSWYEVVRVYGAWRMQEYRAQFEPDL